jgi:hypothetical protein
VRSGRFSKFVPEGSLVRSGRFSKLVTKCSLVRSGRFSTFVTKGSLVRSGRFSTFVQGSLAKFALVTVRSLGHTSQQSSTSRASFFVIRSQDTDTIVNTSDIKRSRWHPFTSCDICS